MAEKDTQSQVTADLPKTEQGDTLISFSRNTGSVQSHSIQSHSVISAASGTGDGPVSKQRLNAFNFMSKRLAHRVIVDYVDVTPDNLINPEYVTMEDYFSHAAFDTKRPIKSELALKSRSTVSTVGMKVYATTINLDDIIIDHTHNTEEDHPQVEIDVEEAPSAYYLPKMFDATSYPPELFIALKETETVYLYDLPTYCYEKGTAEGSATEEDNEYYLYITVGKGRNRKMVNEETQTKSVMSSTRHTLATRPKKRNQICFASMWDMFDTYAQLKEVKEEEEDDEMVLYQAFPPQTLRKKRVLAMKRTHKASKSFEELGTYPQFFDAALLIQRVLAAKDYSNAQKVFRGLVKMDPLASDLVYIYTMKPLWTLECRETQNRPIMSVAFNPKNPDILAVAHGKFNYADNTDGLVCIWCTKNPCVPERLYRFGTPLTSLAFSTNNANWLACGNANGDVFILDVTSHVTKVIAKSKRDTNASFEPIWVTSWRHTDSFHEFVMTAGQDGRINKFTSTKTHDFICTPMMRISTVEGKMKGLETPKQCVKVDVPITRNPAALCLKWHPFVSHWYLVGTDEGCVHKCSTHYLNQHMDVFKAHAGPVYSMEYSSFMPSLLVTCGADNAIRIWIEDLDEVIMTLNCNSAVYDIAWCPINATILLSVNGFYLSVWDLRRKTHAPCTEYLFPTNVTLTYVEFSQSGENIFVGDTLGRIHTFHLEDTPIPPYYQYQMLDDAIKRALCTRPQLLKQLEKLEKFRAKYTK
ncbi:WD repeat-containing protein 78-like [Hyposmocoma kahamanoa]|uniref:WD repeat-containing protein 78-like n=1 Tax=Hyposmocoma kahamanoa TaxID=1477025 RepID=UPI000E6D60F4|nr:WD repeat-containing protein 78-like [Hyposmocoma kahamanoa]